MSSSSHDAPEFEDPLQKYDPLEYQCLLEESLAEEPITAMTIQPCATVSPATSIRDAIHTLRSEAISSLLVVEGDKLTGIFTLRDVLEKVALRYSEMADNPVSDAMTKAPFVVYGTDPAGAAVAAIAVAGYRHVPVVDTDFQLLGVVSPHRVFCFMAERCNQPRPPAP